MRQAYYLSIFVLVAWIVSNMSVGHAIAFIIKFIFGLTLTYLLSRGDYAKPATGHR